MAKRIANFLRSERSQGMTEFALISPVLFFLIFAIVDVGRAVYYDVTISQAANEGARIAIQGEPPDYLQSTNSDVLAAVKSHAIAAQFGQDCVNGPIPSNPQPPANTAWVFITAYPPMPTVEATPRPNAPGNEKGANPDPGVCDNVNAAAGNQPLQVTIYYNFTPITPLLSSFLGGHITLSSWAVYSTEY